MKKKVLCVFSLILYLLCACTMLSEKIEQEMATQVLVAIRTAAGSSIPTSQPTRVLFTDDTGDHLYEVIDGTGWETGLRIREIPEGVWSIGYAMVPYVEIPGGSDYRFVESASRQPPEGKLAEIVEKFETAEDQYLAIYSDGFPSSLELPENSEISAQSGNTLLLDMTQAELPFFEHKVQTLSDAMGAADRIFSLTEVEQFLNGLPAAMMVALLLLFALFLWGYSCILSIHDGGRKGLLWIHALLVLASLWGLHHVLGTIDLPASLLPARNILDWQHYSDTFSVIFSTLEAYGDKAQSLLALKDRIFRQCGEILCCGLLACPALVLAESMILWVKSLWQRRKKRYIGKYLTPRN